MTIIVAILVFGLLIFVHELGHFVVAKRVGIRVDEFSLGMGFPLLQFKRGETKYSLRLLPIGGFVRLAGMEPGDDADDPRGFNRKPLMHRIAVLLAGPGMNFVLAIVMFIFVFSVMGIPSHSNVVGKVLPGRPAATAGLQDGDQIVAINSKPVQNWGDLVAIIHDHPGKPLALEVERQGRKLTYTVTPEPDPQSRVGMIGIEQSWRRLPLGPALIQGVSQAVTIIALIVVSLVQMLTGQVAADVAGPIGVVQLVGEAARFGAASVINFTAILSLNLGLLNLFPIPALDGSRVIFLIMEGIRRRPLDREKENMVHMIGFALLMVLMLIITYKDILRIFG